MHAEILSIGTELVLGHIVDTNATYLSKRLAQLGIDIYHRTTVGDNPKRVINALKKALSRSDIVITIGGLGPTVDDITLSCVGKALSRKFVFDKDIEKYILDYFRKRRIQHIPSESLRQAYIPKGALWFENKVGTAPCVLIEKNKKVLISLPGPPRELIPLFEKNVSGYLKRKHFAGKHIIKTKNLKVTGMIEVEVNRIVKGLLSSGPDTTLGIYVHLGEVSLKITAKARNEKLANRNIKLLEKKIRDRLGNYIYGTNNETLESVVGKTLLKKKKTIALAESCTGGLIANRLTNISGSSKYFNMGVIVYSNDAKKKILGISSGVIKKYGAVSREVALAMAEGVKKISKSTIGIGVTGIAGPTGGTKKKPVGLVYIAVLDSKVKLVRECRFVGSRKDIKLLSSYKALNLVRALLKSIY